MTIFFPRDWSMFEIFKLVKFSAETHKQQLEICLYRLV